MHVGEARAHTDEGLARWCDGVALGNDANKCDIFGGPKIRFDAATRNSAFSKARRTVGDAREALSRLSPPPGAPIRINLGESTEAEHAVSLPMGSLQALTMIDQQRRTNVRA